MQAANSDQTLEPINPFENCLIELRQSWDNKLIFPLSELSKRYSRQDFGIILDCSVNQGKLGVAERFSLAIFSHSKSNLNSCAHRDVDTSGRGHGCKLPVFIKSVHIVDDAKGVIFEIAPSLVWLHVPNEAENLSSHNPLYFSLVSADFLFRDWLFPKDREFNCVATYKPQIMPDS